MCSYVAIMLHCFVIYKIATGANMAFYVVCLVRMWCLANAAHGICEDRVKMNPRLADSGQRPPASASKHPLRAPGDVLGLRGTPAWGLTPQSQRSSSFILPSVVLRRERYYKMGLFNSHHFQNFSYIFFVVVVFVDCCHLRWFWGDMMVLFLFKCIDPRVQ